MANPLSYFARMRAYGLLGALLGGLAVWASPALAATQTVTANAANTFTPSSAIIAKGDTVNWINNGGLHNVHFDDNSYVMPASPSGAAWSVSKTFPNAGTYRYYCEIHGSPGGIGMSGTDNGGAVAATALLLPVVLKLAALNCSCSA